MSRALSRLATGGIKALPQRVPGLSTGTGWVLTTHDETGARLRVLRVNGADQSATYLDERRFELPFEYLSLFDLALAHSHHSPRVALIGGGCFSWPKHALATWPGIRITVVEPEQALVDLARDTFFLAEAEERFASHPLDIRICTGEDFLESCTDTYDALLVDAFSGHEVASPLFSDANLERMSACLRGGGVVAANVVSALSGRHADPLDNVAHGFGRIFDNVCALPLGIARPKVPDNVVVFASDADLKIPGSLPLSR